MARKKKITGVRPVFDSIRKPIAPPTQKFGSEKADEKIHPSQRKLKHKKKLISEDNDADF